MLAGISFAEMTQKLSFSKVSLQLFCQLMCISNMKEEIEEEGIVNNIELLIRFMEAAGIVNGQVLNKVKIAKTQKLPQKSLLKITMHHGNFQTNDDKAHAVNCKAP